MNVCSILLVCAVSAIDLSDENVRAMQPVVNGVSHAAAVEDGEWADGRWAYRFRITKPWSEDLPEWPSVTLKTSVTDFSPYDRLVIDMFNDAIGGDAPGIYLAPPTGRPNQGCHLKVYSLPERDFRRFVYPLNVLAEKKIDPKNITRLHLYMTRPVGADVRLSGFHLLKKGEEPPPVSEKFMTERVEPARAVAAQEEQNRHRKAITAFLESCRAAGQTGDPAWFGQAASMDQVRPRADLAKGVKPASAFALSLARGETEAVQAVVIPNERDLSNVRVEVKGLSDLTVTASPVGYVRTENPPPYRYGYNIATNLPGGYARVVRPTGVGWWPDPILTWKTSTDVKGADVQSFWVQVKCPGDLPAGIRRGTLCIVGDGWRKEYPLTVRVYGFSVPKKSPLPLAITFSPAIHTHREDEDTIRVLRKMSQQPDAPHKLWQKHRLAWADFLADHYVTWDNLYRRGRFTDLPWEEMKYLDAQGRLGRFNLGYWRYPKDLSPDAIEAWREDTKRTIDANYAKAKELGWLDRAYLYGCDEVLKEFFPNIKWAISELKKMYPGVPLSTTAVDRDLGVGNDLAGIDWHTPTTTRYREAGPAQVAKARAEGRQVWWYIACNQRAPYANLFVENPPIEARMLMGAQTAMERPDGFLYYHISMWNTPHVVGDEVFTDWNPRSYTRYHGDGCWVLAGPDGIPCTTQRFENFRDGLEDFAYVLEYERLTGRRCEVPPEVYRAVDQFTDDADAYYRWRDALAEAIEKQQPLYAVDFAAQAPGCTFKDYKNRTPHEFKVVDGKPVAEIRSEVPAGNPAELKKKLGGSPCDTSWGFRTAAFAVRPGDECVVKLTLSGDLPPSVYLRPGASIAWLGADGKPLRGVDALGKPIDLVAPLNFPLREATMKVEKKGRGGENEGRTALTKSFVPAEAAQATIGFELDWPDLKHGERVNISAVEYYAHTKGESWAFDDIDAPELQVLTPSPCTDLNAALRFRLTDATGVDWSKFSCKLDGRLLAANELTRDGDMLTYTPSAPWQDETVHSLEVTCADTLGFSTVEWGFIAFSKTPVRHAKWTVRDDGMILRDGEPFFPLGITSVRACGGNDFDLDKGVKELKDNGVNFVHTYMVRNRKGHVESEHYGELVDACDKYGVVMLAEPAYRKLDANRDALMASNLLYGRGCRMMGMWGIGDDTSRFQTPQQLKRNHRFCKAVDPDLLTISVDAACAAFQQAPYIPFADVLGLEIYPIREATPQPGEMPQVASMMDGGWEAIALSGEKNRSVLSMPQTFKGWNRWLRYPTKEEVRSQFFISLACKARCLVSYTSFNVNGNEGPLNDPVHKKEYFEVTREIAALIPSLVTRDAPMQPEVVVADGPQKNVMGGASVRLLLKEDGLLVVANTADRPVTAEIRLPNGKKITETLPRWGAVHYRDALSLP